MRRAVATIVVTTFALACVVAASSGASPSAAYDSVKSAMALVPTVSLKDRTADGTYDVATCAIDADFTGTGLTTRTGVYADIASGVLAWERDLPRLGYPPRVWQSWVAHYESAAVATANRVAPDRFYVVWTAAAPKVSGLRSILVAYRESHPKLIAIDPFGGCGAGEVGVTVVTKPLASQIAIIPTFFFELCRVRRIDPNDLARCDHWREVRDGEVDPVSGDYHYQVRWGDGTVRRGTLQPSITSGQTITLLKP